MAYEEEIPRLVLQESSIPALLTLYQWWLNWGDYDSTGAKILERLGEVAAGSPEAIATLKKAACGAIPKTSITALSCLRQLAMNGDELAGVAFQDIQQHQQEQRIKQPSFIEKRRAVEAARLKAED
ncbi:hypothetical protein [Leptolyngbya sp. CCY15150]|uniref:hypothetical protein n=1 Tax=Leptolyngbya sp. CCY15150 TaxID=2767772 RepID=UPI001951EDDF|nr:hypothetical protein [Leptolyngbya sp. CCY15150]